MKYLIRFLYVLKAALLFPVGIVVVLIGFFIRPVWWAVYYIAHGKEPSSDMWDNPWEVKVADWLVKVKYDE